MLACITEVESRTWRDGMIEGLTRGYALAADDGLHGNGILRTVMQRFNQLTPPAYHSYITAYLHQDCIKYWIIPKMLSFWQWRTLASDLAEIAQVAELLGCTTGFRAEEVRCAPAARHPGGGSGTGRRTLPVTAGPWRPGRPRSPTT